MAYTKKTEGRHTNSPPPRTRASYMANRARPAERFQATCNECGAVCEVPFKPNGKKPVYCRDCFKGKEGTSVGIDKSAARSAPQESLSMQLELINAKLDRLLKAVGSAPRR